MGVRMGIGWAVSGIALLYLSTSGLPPAYWCVSPRDGTYVTTCDAEHRELAPCANRTAVDTATKATAARPCNAAAAQYGGHVATLLFIACLGYVCADVAADGLTVSYAQREPIAIRGRTQSTVYLIRSIGHVIGLACAHLDFLW